MKGILLAGGTGSRLWPLTRNLNKHLLPVGGEPMVVHGIRKLVAAGLDEILLITNPGHLDAFRALLGDGENYGCRLRYCAQPTPGGIAQALALGEAFSAGDRVAVLLGDNLFGDDFRPLVDRFRAQARGARVVLKEADHPERFGVAEIRNGRIVSIEEKPLAPRSRLCVTGLYLYDPAVFELIRDLKPSARGELEITDLNLAWLRRGALEFEVLQGWWSDAGTPEALAQADAYLRGTGGARPE